jgi:hypothetical protein
MNPEAGSRSRWPWDMKRPRFMGEDFFATGINPADYAQWAWRRHVPEQRRRASLVETSFSTC